MKKLLSALLCASLALTGCANTKNIGGKNYEPYGLANQDTTRSENVCYEIPVGNIFAGVVLVETIFVPVYILGWDLYEAKQPKVNGSCGPDAKAS